MAAFGDHDVDVVALLLPQQPAPWPTLSES